MNLGDQVHVLRGKLGRMSIFLAHSPQMGNKTGSCKTGFSTHCMYMPLALELIEAKEMAGNGSFS